MMPRPTTVTLEAKYLPKGQYLLSWDRYNADENCPSLTILHPETLEPECRASVFVGVTPKPGHIFIKNWSENEGILQALCDAGILQDTGERVPTGFTEAALCKIL